MKSIHRRIFATLTAVIVLGGCAASTGGLVESIVKAPIVPDGDVIGAVTDLTINLAIDPDPAVSGLSMKTGETIEITLPDAFVFADPDNYPIMDLFGASTCTFEQLSCSTALLLHGWPQHPILPSFPPGETPSYSISYDKQPNRITLTVQRSLDDVPLPGPGVKQVHLMLLGFHNPKEPGDYPIHVSINGADGQQKHAGEGMVTIRPAVVPSLNVISIFDENGAEPPNLNTIYQSVRPGESTPLAWDFLAWDAEGKAFDGLFVEQLNASTGLLTRAGNTVGHIEFDVPPGAEGHRLEGGPSIALDHEPVFGMPIPTGHLTVHFTAGSIAGRYRTVFQLEGGDPVVMYVDVVE